MQLPDDVLTVFSAPIESGVESHHILIPERELEIGQLEVDETYRIAILGSVGKQRPPRSESSASEPEKREVDGPPVAAGDALEVEIDDVGDQGDGIARVGPGYVVFVPDTEAGDRVVIEITKTQENFAFAEVIEPEPLSR